MVIRLAKMSQWRMLVGKMLHGQMSLWQLSCSAKSEWVALCQRGFMIWPLQMVDLEKDMYISIQTHNILQL